MPRCDGINPRRRLGRATSIPRCTAPGLNRRPSPRRFQPSGRNSTGNTWSTLLSVGLSVPFLFSSGPDVDSWLWQRPCQLFEVATNQRGSRHEMHRGVRHYEIASLRTNCTKRRKNDDFLNPVLPSSRSSDRSPGRENRAAWPWIVENQFAIADRNVPSKTCRHDVTVVDPIRARSRLVKVSGCPRGRVRVARSGEIAWLPDYATITMLVRGDSPLAWAVGIDHRPLDRRIWPAADLAKRHRTRPQPPRVQPAIERRRIQSGVYPRGHR